MKHTNKTNSHLGGFTSGASLGGKVTRYRDKQNIYKQGAPAYTLFYIQEGGVRLFSSVRNYREHVADLLTSSAEQRLARVLLRLAHLDKRGPAVVEIPILSHQVLADMVGTTRPRVNLFMNQFRKRGLISYDGGLEVHPALRKVLRNRQ